MLEKQQQLYQRICDHELDDPSHEIGFLAHLMRANGWSRLFALHAIEEYRKFVFLALVAGHQVSPSDQVDQVWHLHLLFSDAYWNDFCPRVLGRPLHHHPTKGGQQERDRFHELYRATIRSYRQHFGEPPADLWPPVDVRFGRDLQMQRGRIRPRFRPWRGWRWTSQTSILLACVGLMGCGIAKAAAGARSDPPPESGYLLLNLQSPVLDLLGRLVWPTIYLASLMMGFVVAYRLLRPLLLQPSVLSTTPQLDDEDLAYLSAGPTRVLELGLASLVQQGVLKANPSTRKLALMGRTDEATPEIAQQVLTAYHQLARRAGAEVAYTDLRTLSRYDFKSRQEFLQSKKLLLKGLARLIAQQTVYPSVPVVMMFFLLTVSFILYQPPQLDFALPFCLLGFCLGLMKESGRTLWGDSVLKLYQNASTHADPLQRIALLGPAAMSGGSLDDLRSLI